MLFDNEVSSLARPCFLVQIRAVAYFTVYVNAGMFVLDTSTGMHLDRAM